MPKAKKASSAITKPYQSRAHLSPAIRPVLTPEQVREIRKIYKMADRLAKAAGKPRVRSGLPQELATRYGVTKYAIKHIRQGERWSTLK